MSDVFISYKREDELHAARLAAALKDEGFAVWWDVSLPAGEDWAAQISAALARAKCVVVLWTRRSVGPEGKNVHAEAHDGAERGILVPVRLQRVKPPLFLRATECVDLIGWRGRRSDAAFQDLCANVRARIERRPAPPKTARERRLGGWLWFGSGVGVLATLAGGAFNLFAAQDHVCALPSPGSALSDACGSLGIGRRPTREERLAWRDVPKDDCNALRAHIDRFPRGTTRVEAKAMLDAGRVPRETWVRQTSTAALNSGLGERAEPNEAAARRATLDQAQADAELQCSFYGKGISGRAYRVIGAVVRPDAWRCERWRDGVRCSFKGSAECALEERVEVMEERCGSQASK